MILGHELIKSRGSNRGFTVPATFDTENVINFEILNLKEYCSNSPLRLMLYTLMMIKLHKWLFLLSKLLISFRKKYMYPLVHMHISNNWAS